MDLTLFILRASLTAIPLYVCNGLALVFGGKKPIDFDKKFFDGRPLLGRGKTIKGTFSGIFFAFLAALAISVVFPESNEIMGASYLLYGALLAVGAVVGDFAGSFLKRRIGIERGKSFFPADQLDFVAGGLVLVSFVAMPSLPEIVFLLAFTLISHVIGNRVAYIARMKKVPW